MDYTLQDLLSDEDTAPSTAERAPAAPEPIQPAAAPQGGFTLDQLLSDDDVPAQNVSRETIPPAAHVPSDASKNQPNALVRGILAGTSSTPESLAGVADIIDDLMGGEAGSTAGNLSAWFREQAEAAKSGTELQSKGALQIRSVDEALTYLGETVGQALGSTVAPIAGAAVGGVAGGLSPVPGGAAAGALIGQGGVNMLTGVGSMRNALYDDPEIRKKVEDGDLSKKDLVPYALAGGAVIGALDSFGMKKIMDLTGLGKDAVQDAVKMTIRKAILEGTKSEGITETLQQIAQEVTTVLSGGRPDVQQRLTNVVESGIGGAVGGGALGGAARTAGVAAEKVLPKSPEKVDQETQSDAGASTPGGIGAPPAQPASQPAADPSQQPLVNPKPVDPDAAAAVVGAPVSVNGTPVPGVTTLPSVQMPPAVTVDGEEDTVSSPELYEDKALHEALKVREVEARGVTVADPQDVEKLALQVNKPMPETVGTGRALQPPVEAATPPVVPPAPVGPPPVGQEEVPPAPASLPVPGAGTAAVVPTAPEVVPPAPAVTGADVPMQVAGEPVVPEALEMKGPPVAEAGVAPGSSTVPAEAVLEAVPGAFVDTTSPAVQTPVGENLAVAENISAQPNRRVDDAMVQLRDAMDLVLAEEDTDADTNRQIVEAVIQDLAPRLQGETRMPNAIADAYRSQVEDTARGISRAYVREAAERTAASEQSRKAQADEETRVAAEQSKAVQEKARKEGAPQQRARNTKAGTKKAEDLEAEGPADERPFQRRAEAAIKEHGEKAPSYYRKGLEAITRRKATGKGKAKGEKAEERESAKRDLAAARAEEITETRKREAQEGLKKQSEQKEQAAEREKLELPNLNGYGTPGWKSGMQSALRKFYNANKPTNEDGTEATRMSPSYPPEKNFLIFIKKNLDTEDGLVDIAVVKQLMDQGKMVDAANAMRENDISVGRGSVAEEASGSMFEEVSENDWGYDTDEGYGSPLAIEGKTHGIYTTYDSKGDPSPNVVQPKDVSTVGDMLKRLRKGAPDAVTDFLGNKVPNFIRKAIGDRLEKMVGDVPVYTVSPEQIVAAMKPEQRGTVKNPAGLYVPPSPEARAAGDPGYILINRDQQLSDEMFDPGAALHVAMHEATHAAVAAAIDNNWNGSREIFTRIYAYVKRVHPDSTEYGLRSGRATLSAVQEFVAEAFSNPEFQELLAITPVPESIARDVKAIRGGPVSAWDLFVNAVATALQKMGFGRVGMTALEAVLRVGPSAMMDPAEQAARMREQLASREHLDGFDDPRGHADPLPIMRAVRASQEGLQGAAANSGGTARRTQMKWLETTAGLMRRSAEYFGGENNPITRLGEAMMKRDARAQQLKEEGDKLAGELVRYQKANPADAAAMSDVLTESTIAGIDPRLDVAGNVAKRNVSANGVTDEYTRQIIREQNKAWNALSPKAKAMATKLIDHYTKSNRDMTNLQIRQVVKQIVQSGLKLPPGVDAAELERWVASKEIHRETGSAIRPRTQKDEDLHKALGGSAKTLADLERVLQRNGIYVPLMRDGEWVVSAEQPVAVPKGATKVQTQNMPNRKHLDNLLIFTDKNDVLDYQRTASQNGIDISAVDSIWIDPSTGKRQNKQEPSSVQRWVVHVNNKVVEFKDTYAQARALEKDLRDQGYKTHGTRQRRKFFEEGLTDVSPAHIERLVHAIDAQQGDNQEMARFMTAQIRLAALRTQSGSRAKHRNIKREGIKGYNRDMAQALMDYTSQNAHAVAGLTEGQAAWDHLAEAREYEKQHLTDVGGEPQRRQEIANEMERRLSSSHWHDKSGLNLIRLVTSYSGIVHLMSPAYSALNAIQPAMTTFPVLSAKYGMGNVLREMNRAYGKIGRIRTAGRGFKRIGQAARGGVFNVHSDLSAAFAGEKDAGLLQKGLDFLRDTGMLDAAGIETELAEHGKSKVTNVIHRLSLIARAMPQTIEGLNRGVTLVASIRAQKALNPGLSDDVVIRRAMHDVEQTQFGYGSANMPTMFNHPIGALALQFKKYGVSIGNVIGHNIIRALPMSRFSKEEKRIARRTLAGMTLMGVAFAGAAGIPGIELPKTIATILSGLFGTDEWDDTMATLEKGLARLTNATTAEAVMRGLPRLLNLDIASRVGYDSLYLFGEPQEMNEAGFKAWAFDLAAGAPIGMFTKLLQATSGGGWDKVPLPKMVNDTIKAVGKFRTGDFTASEAGIKAFGIQPGSASHKWETGEAGTAFRVAKKEKAAKTERFDVMKQWLNIPPGPKQATARARIMADVIRPYNKTVPTKERISVGDLYAAERNFKKKTRERVRQANAS